MNKFTAWLTQAFFIVSMSSGIIVVFAYHPFDAYNSIQKINYIIPFGSLFRQIHYFSSETFVVSLLLHISLELYKKKINISFTSWNYSIIAMISVFILMFTGFVLKADQSANAAALVSFSLISDTPILDNFLPLFKDTSTFYWKFFIWHIVFLPILLSFAIYKHIKKISVNIRYFTTAISITMFVTLIIPMPIDIALELQVDHIQGPWFFLGAENLLQLGFSLSVVNLILLVPFVFMFFVYNNKYKIFFIYLLILWMLGYMTISVLY